MPEVKPIVVSIWCGNKKPNNLNQYLRPFVDEMKYLLQNGIEINNYDVKFLIRCIICDSPARSFLKGIQFKLIKNHSNVIEIMWGFLKIWKVKFKIMHTKHI